MNFSEIGNKRIGGDITPVEKLPFEKWEDFALFFTVEYPVKDFAAEVGFYAHALGLEFLSLDESYAIVKNQDGSTFSFISSDLNIDLAKIKIQWFTNHLDNVIRVLERRGVEIKIIRHSEIQRIIRMQSPNGVTVEIWSGDESGS